jgi:lipoyl(octanoyl) transferase
MTGGPDVEWLGEMRYAEALALQQKAVSDRLAGATCDRVLLVEHPPVVTLGRSTDPANLRETPDALRARGIDVHEIARGGDVTWHAPGQLVGYPILDLDALDRRDVHDHLRRLEAVLIDALEALDVPAQRVPGRTGVFIDRARSPRSEGPPRKIASIGVGVRKWVTYHGFALNVTNALSGFEAIVPCGLHDVVMTSVEAELESGSGPGAATRAPASPEVTKAGQRASLDERVRSLVAERLVEYLRDGAPSLERI